MEGNLRTDGFFPYSEKMTQFSDFINSVQAKVPFPDRLERATLNETWFSDMRLPVRAK